MQSDACVAVLVAILCFPGVAALADDEGCVKIADCPAALWHVSNVRINPESLNILRKAHCGFKGMYPVVKCGSIPTPTHNIPNPIGNRDECSPLQNCSAALRLIKTRVFDPQVVNLFRSIHCGMTKQQPLIYCQRINI